MYYLNIDNVIKQYDNAKGYCLAYAKQIREQFAEMSHINLCNLINLLKKDFKIVDDCEINEEERIACLLSNKQGRAQDLVDFLLLVLFPFQNVSATKFSMILANRNVVEGVLGSSTNPIYHFGLCFKFSDEKMTKERYIDINLAFEQLLNIKICTNGELRAIFSKDFYFTIINRIYDVQADGLEMYYDQIIKNSDKAKPRSKV